MLPKYKLILLILLVCGSKSEEPCSNEVKTDFCDKVIHLPPIDEIQVHSNQIFFIESFGRDHLLVPHVCTIESSLRYSNLTKFIVAMTSKTLDLSANNVTCQLFKEFSNKGLEFRHVSVEDIIEGTPFEKIHQDNKIHEETANKAQRMKHEEAKFIHYSDILRLLLVHKYGGWYSDLDVLFLKPLNELENVIGCDDVSIKQSGKVTGRNIANGFFHFTASHLFLSKSMKDRNLL